MARVILATPSSRIAVPSLSTSKVVKSDEKLSLQAVETCLRQRRSAAYIEEINKLDAGAHACNRAGQVSLKASIQHEFPDVSIEQLSMCGIVARCHLGTPHEVHTLEYSGDIIQHYKTWQSLPGLLESARTLALNPGYAFIEVYPDHMVAVAENGDTSLIKR